MNFITKALDKLFKVKGQKLQEGEELYRWADDYYMETEGKRDKVHMYYGSKRDKSTIETYYEFWTKVKTNIMDLESKGLPRFYEFHGKYYLIFSIGVLLMCFYFKYIGLCQINNVDITTWTKDVAEEKRKIICKTGYHYGYDFRDWSFVEITYPGIDKDKLIDGEYTIPGYNAPIDYKEWKCKDKY